MNLFGLEIRRHKVTPAVQAVEVIEPENKSLDTGLQLKQLQNFISQWNIASYPGWNTRKEVDSYVEIDDVYSIISLLARSAATIPFYGFTVKDEKSMKTYLREPHQTIHKKYYQLKSMEDLPESDPVYRLLESLGYEFMCGLYTLIFINGEVFLWKERIKFGARKGIEKLHIIHPADMQVFVSTTFPQQVTGYRFITPYGEMIDFLPDEIIHVKYFNPQNLYNRQWRGQSPLSSARKRLSRIEGAMDVSVSQMQNGGVPGIVFDEAIPNTKEAQEIGDLRKTKYAAYSNNTANKGAPYWSSGKLGYIPMGLKLVDLDLVNLSKEDFAKLCNNYHVSTVLLNDNTTSTNNNIELQSKRMFTNGILPTVYQVRDAFISGILPDFSGPRRYIECDMSGITELQPDMKVTADALKLMDFISPNEKRKIMRFDDSDEPLMDSIIIDTGKMLLDDLNGVPNDGTTTE